MNEATHIQVNRMDADQPKLRIAIVTETYPPDINGVAHTLSKIVDGLKARGHSLCLIRPRQAKDDLPQMQDQLREILVRGLPIPFYKQLRMGFPAKRELLRLWSLQRPDLVHIATEGPLGWSALQAARKLKLPISTDFRTNFHAYSLHYGIGWLSGAIVAYLRKFHNASQVTMVPTQQLRQELTGLGFERLSVVPRGVDTDLFSPDKRKPALRSDWGASDKTVVLLCVGRLAAEKNLDLVLHAYQATKIRHSDVKLVLVGDGPLRAELARKCPEIIFSGFQTGLQLAEHYASADLFVFPSLTETFGNVTIEAMASGLPVVAFDHAAAGELISSGENGVLAAPSDNPAFVSQLVDLVGEPCLRRNYGEQAKMTAMEQEWRVILERTENVFHQVVQQSVQTQMT